MKKHWCLLLFLFSGFLLITACSASESKKDHIEFSDSEVGSNEMAVVESESTAYESDEHVEESADSSTEMPQSANDIPAVRMIIHKAFLQFQVADFEKAQLNIERKVTKYNGYIVESNVYHAEDKTISGNIMLRIPEKHFQSFLTDAEGEATDILQRNVTGEDVTEHYVDLEARLKSKRVLEERLLTFMEQAEKTEDLLKISSDLAVVQEEIEVIVGKMKYLENQTALSTVEIHLFENRIVIPDIDSKGLDTWEKTKKQFTTSINYLLAFASSLVVFFVGNFPILLLLLVIISGVYFFIRRKINRKE
ncbi:DUF4349 domain-containing protein [Sporosarcina pasteurii]|uniref:DUF4349 domain-containing protein n=1 Tax=Sporosarcina pasteurii TaxID=1474 RepID=UPI001FB9C524|nr:DUF4349 domain-containing protein [Sporosarcina pasteurii]MDS9471144.1 DUF4349 domain-containing protein [Sporosarcina pasteurii]